MFYLSIKKFQKLAAHFFEGAFSHVKTTMIFIAVFCCGCRWCFSGCRRWFFIVEVKMIEIVFIIILDLAVIFAGIIWLFKNWLISSSEYCISVRFRREMIFSDAALSDIFTSKSQMMVRKFVIMPSFAIRALMKCACI